MYTYQDYLKIKDDRSKLQDFVAKVINEHKSSKAYKTALIADEYDAERNVTILNFVKMLYGAAGQKIMDETASNMKLTSNFFARLNIQRCTYSLGNGLTFQDKEVVKKLGANSDKVVKDAGYYGLIHGLSFLYWAYDHIHMFKLTEFAPLWNETTSALCAGVRFWQMDSEKTLHAVLYTPEGYIEYESEKGDASGLKARYDDFTPYLVTVQTTPAIGGDVETAHNYAGLPIIPLWGSRLHQSTLVGMRNKIDAFDLIHSGFANDVNDCAQIYWLVSNAGGMSEKDLSQFRERLLFRHIANVPHASDGVEVKPYTQEVPYNSRKVLLDQIRNQIYEDFGALDVHTVAAGATNDHIDAAYQPLDENADDFEYQIIDAIQKLLALQGVDADTATPQFKRNRISNQKEQVEMVMLEAPYLDDETVLNKLPNISSEEVEQIMKKKTAEDLDRMIGDEPPDDVIDDV